MSYADSVSAKILPKRVLAWGFFLPQISIDWVPTFAANGELFKN